MFIIGLNIMMKSGDFFTLLGQTIAEQRSVSSSSGGGGGGGALVSVAPSSSLTHLFEPTVLPETDEDIDPQLLIFLQEVAEAGAVAITATSVDNGSFFHLQVDGQTADSDESRLRAIATQIEIPTLIKPVPSDFFKTDSFIERDGWTPSSLSDGCEQVISQLFTETYARTYLAELQEGTKKVLSIKMIDSLFPDSSGVQLTEQQKALLIEELEKKLSDFMRVQRSESNVGQQFGFSGTEEPKCFRVIFELQKFVHALLATGATEELINQIFKVKYALFMRYEDWLRFSKKQTQSLSVMLSTKQRLLAPAEDETHDLLQVGFKVCLGSSFTPTSKKIKVIADISASMTTVLGLLKEGMILALQNLIAQATLDNLESLNVSIIFHDTGIETREFNAMDPTQHAAMLDFINRKSLGSGTEYIEAYREAFKEPLTSNDILMAFTDGSPNSYISGDYAQYVASTLGLTKFPARFYGFYFGKEGDPAINILRAIGALSSRDFVYPTNTRNFKMQCERIAFPSSESLKLTIAGLDYKVTNGAWQVLTLPLIRGQEFSLEALSLSYDGMKMLPTVREGALVVAKKIIEKPDHFYAAQMKFVFNHFQVHAPVFPNINALTEQEIATLLTITQETLRPYLSTAVYGKVIEYLNQFDRLIKARASGDPAQLEGAIAGVAAPLRALLLSSQAHATEPTRGQASRSQYTQREFSTAARSGSF
jgi:hypothetical protein